MQKVKRREELFRASAWRGPLFILPFWAEGDRRVSHATRRHPAGHPRKGAIAAGKEGPAIGINYSEWRGLCLLFSPLSKRSHGGKEFNPNRRLSASLLERLSLPSHQFNIPAPPPPSKLSTPTSSGMLWGFVVLWGPGCECVRVLWGFITSWCASVPVGMRDTKWSQLFHNF